MPMTEETRKKIFHTLKKHLKKMTPPMVEGEKTPHHDYCITGNKPVPYGYNKKIIPGMHFAAIANRSDSVTFHFFPCYYNTGMKDKAPNLYKCLRGKTCFHFKKEEQVNEKELKALLKAGAVAWKKAGYMK